MDSYLIPLFWQHHESENVLQEEIDRMHESGIGAFIVEARPHPEYLRDGWWRDLDVIITRAKKYGMKVWIFDDSTYPSGYADGLIKQNHRHHCKRYLAQHHIDAVGPLPGSSFLVVDFVEAEDKLVAVICAKQLQQEGALDPDSLTDITCHIRNGILYWDVPEGNWRIFILVSTPNGGEEHTRDYLNPLSREAARCFIDLIYEEHYTRLKNEFGNTFAGFFTDEPRYGNQPSYQTRLGDPDLSIPWIDDLLLELDGHPLNLGDYTRLLPLLWYSGGNVSADVRYAYMDVVSRRFSEEFIGQIGAWCREHGVESIGHFVEENGAHARLGYGPGHFFRASKGFSMAGIDVVCNLYPGRRDGKFTTSFNYFDADFNHWGLAKLASSEASLDPKKKGRAFCEAFGAYGWSEGLKTMKWITDAICVRGINYITPHAFSPMEYPDSDCPPHFYARGRNPQWPFFHIWSQYANRVCDQLNGGQVITPAAVLYHAEAEWGGEYQPFEKIVKRLAENLIDSTVVSADYIMSGCTSITNGNMVINGNRFRTLIIPYSQYIPPGLYLRLRQFCDEGFKIVFCEQYPDRCYGGVPFHPEGFHLCKSANVPDYIRSRDIFDISCLLAANGLIYRHYVKNGLHSYFFVNEDIRETVDTYILFMHEEPACLYDPMQNRYYTTAERQANSGREIRLILEPYQSVFVLFENRNAEGQQIDLSEYTLKCRLEDGWDIYLRSYDSDVIQLAFQNSFLFDITHPDRYPAFSGSILYKTKFDWDCAGDALLDMGRVYESVRVNLNGHNIGAVICPPYRMEIPCEIFTAKANCLTIEVVNTLVKANHDNPHDKYWPQEPAGLLGPVTIFGRVDGK